MVTKMCIYILIHKYKTISQKLKVNKKTMEKKLVALLVMCIMVAASMQFSLGQHEASDNPCFIDCFAKNCAKIKNDDVKLYECDQTCDGRCLD